MVMNERFNVSGAMLVKLFGRPGRRPTSFENKAARVRDIGIAQALYARLFLVALTLTAALATAFAYGFGGVAAVHGELAVGTVVALTAYLARLYQPLTQLSNVQPRRDDHPGLFRTGLRGARPGPDDPGGARRRAIPAGPGHHRVRPRRLLLPERRGRLAGLARAVAVLERSRAPPGPPRRVLHGWTPDRWWPWSDRRAPARPRSPRSSRASTTSRRARCAIDGIDVRAGHPGVPARRRRGGDPGPPPLPRHPAGQPRLRPARRRPRRSSSTPCDRPRSSTWWPRCPTGSTPWSASGATASREARSSGSRWPG